jgi:hypothetical protein
VLNLGQMILEGDVQTLISDQRRLSITVQDLPDAARTRVEEAVRAAGATVVSVGHPQTSLESLFLDALKQDKRGAGQHD